MGARRLVVLVAVLGFPLIAAAQSPGGAGARGPSSRGVPSMPRSTVSRPAAPPVSGSVRPTAPPSQPLPQPFAGSVPNPIMRPAGPNDVFRATPRTYAPRYGRFSGRAPWWSTYYGAGGYYAPYETATPVEEVDPPQGRLALTVTPSSTQIFADGFFMGTVADFQDRGLWLPVGPRRIELRAEGYDTVTFDVRINEDRPVEYQRNLTGVSPRSEAPRVAAVPKTFYVIPGCYAGDTPPRMNRLPSGCSTNNVRTVPPVLSRLSLSNK